MSSNTLHWQYASDKTHKEVVVFIHHFGGNYKTTKRHIKMMNSLGYDCVSFDFSNNFTHFSFKNFFSFNFNTFFHRGGIVRLWTEELLEVLKQIDPPIILYSFSSLSLSIPKAIITVPNKITAWICDGGPFFNVQSGFNRFYRQIHSIKNPILLFILKLIGLMAWRSWKLEKIVQKQIHQFPKNFPVLSIRGANDKLVHPTDIEKVFKDFEDHLNLNIYIVKHGSHLDGLSHFPIQYKQRVTRFLEKLTQTTN